MLVNSKPPTPGIVSRGIALEGFCSILAGLWGSGTGSTTLTENVHTIEVTKVASRRAVEVGALFLIMFSFIGKPVPTYYQKKCREIKLLHKRVFMYPWRLNEIFFFYFQKFCGLYIFMIRWSIALMILLIFLLSGTTALISFLMLIGKIGAILASIPLALAAAILCFMWALTVALGLSTLQYSQTASFRNIAIVGVSLFLGLSIPAYFQQYQPESSLILPSYFIPYAAASNGPVHTGSKQVSYFFILLQMEILSITLLL